MRIDYDKSSPYWLLRQILFYMDNTANPNTAANPFLEARNYCRLVEEGVIQPDGSYVEETEELEDLDEIDGMLDDL